MSSRLSKEYMTNRLEKLEKQGKDVHFIIGVLANEVRDFDNRITQMAQNNDVHNPLYDELQELREVSLQSIKSWQTMI